VNLLSRRKKKNDLRNYIYIYTYKCMLTLQIKNNFVCHIPTTSNLNTKSNRFSVFQFRYTCTCIYTKYFHFRFWYFVEIKKQIYNVYVIMYKWTIIYLIWSEITIIIILSLYFFNDHYFLLKNTDFSCPKRK
jgi:hypothetical protein